MEENKNENTEEFTPPAFGAIKAASMEEFISKLNNRAKDFYFPVWDTARFYENDIQVISKYMPDIDLSETQIKERVDIITLVYDSEQYLSLCESELRDKKDELLLTADWKKISDELRQKISNQAQRDAYIRTQTSTLSAKHEEAAQWVKFVKNMDKIHQLPTQDPPWVKYEKQESESSKDDKKQDMEVEDKTEIKE